MAFPKSSGDPYFGFVGLPVGIGERVGREVCARFASVNPNSPPTKADPNAKIVVVRVVNEDVRFEEIVEDVKRNPFTRGQFREMPNPCALTSNAIGRNFLCMSGNLRVPADWSQGTLEEPHDGISCVRSDKITRYKQRPGLTESNKNNQTRLIDLTIRPMCKVQ